MRFGRFFASRIGLGTSVLCRVRDLLSSGGAICFLVGKSHDARAGARGRVWPCGRREWGCFWIVARVWDVVPQHALDASFSAHPHPRQVFSDGFVSQDLGSSAAQSVILLILVGILTVVQFKYIERKVHWQHANLRLTTMLARRRLTTIKEEPQGVASSWPTIRKRRASPSNG